MSQNSFTNLMRDKTDYFSRNEIDTMLKYCIDTGRIRDYVLFFLLYRSGRRISEIVGQPPYTLAHGLRPVDIRDEEPLIEWCILKKRPIKLKRKDGKVRKVESLLREKLYKEPMKKLKAIDREAHGLIKEYVENQEILSHSRVFPITRQRADQLIKEVAKECKIARASKKIHIHQFRHSHAIHFLKAHPRDPTALMKLNQNLEHSTIEITKTYLQFTQYDVRESMDKAFNETEFSEVD